MQKVRFILVIISALYIMAATALIIEQKQIKDAKPAASPKEARVFCWDDDKNDFKKIDTEFFGDISFSSPVSTSILADIDNDNVSESYDLFDGILTVTENSLTIWQSDARWEVDSFVLADSNNDGISDLNLSLWKPGNFGEVMPLWVRENDMSVKNHFFIYDLVGNEMKSLWQSSNLPSPNRQFLIDDINADGENELIVIEGDYADSTRSGQYLAVWKWHEWGFLNEWRSDKGEFSGLKVEDFGGKKCIMGMSS